MVSHLVVDFTRRDRDQRWNSTYLAYSGKLQTYVDFGIPSVHGLVNSLLLSIGLCRFALFLLTRSRRHLFVPVFILIWSILVVTRNMLLVSLIEFGILFFRIKPVQKKTLIKLAASLVTLILVFGAIGTFAGGRKTA